MKGELVGHQGRWEQITPIQITAVDRQCIDLALLICPTDVAGRCVSTPPHPDDDDVLLAIEGAPLALHLQETVPKIQNEVVLAVFRDRSEDWDPEFERCSSDLGFCDGPLVIGRVHERMFPYQADENRSGKRKSVSNDARFEAIFAHAGGIDWAKLKKSSGSYFALTARSLTRFAP